MNHCAIQQGAFAACEDMWSSVSSISDKKDAVVCPKPRRLGLLNATITEPIRPLRWHVSHQQELCDSRAGADLLDIILAKLKCQLLQGRDRCVISKGYNRTLLQE
ncbi:uncharacterized protein [Solanum lycopersicum]|uniref:uncharacterized protein isoform X2 n=1 Tax=Solanum lycopersicum TaxID=4081 RepID=UPI000276A730|nr:uncharacterized protein LOC101264582 isoform X2 [Solanum lycopersicum]